MIFFLLTNVRLFLDNLALYLFFNTVSKICSFHDHHQSVGVKRHRRLGGKHDLFHECVTDLGVNASDVVVVEEYAVGGFIITTTRETDVGILLG